MGKIALTIFYQKNERTVLAKVPFDEVIHVVITMLVNNFVIEGDGYYSAQIRVRDTFIPVVDFNQKLNEIGVDTDAILFVFDGSETDYKAPPTPPKPAKTSVEPFPPKRKSRSNPKVDYGAATITFLKRNQIPGRCATCDGVNWVQERLDKNNTAIDDLKMKNLKLEDDLEGKNKAEWFAVGGSVLFAIAQFTEEPKTLRWIVFGIAIIFAIISVIVHNSSHLRKKAKSKGKK